MSVWSSIRALAGGHHAAEHIVSSVVESYEKHRTHFPGKDPHYYLTLAFLAYQQAIGADSSNPMAQLEAFRDTYEFACVPPPKCARALGIFILQKSYMDLLMQDAALQHERAELLAPIREAKDAGRLAELYKRYNPSMWNQKEWAI